VPRKLHLRGGAKGHNKNDSTLPGSAALGAASFITCPSVSILFLTSSCPRKKKLEEGKVIESLEFSFEIRYGGKKSGGKR
jgi:hypothetical protein